jgi:hypothetical protein
MEKKHFRVRRLNAGFNLCMLINTTLFKYPVVFDCVTQRGFTGVENSEAEKSESVAMFNGILQLLK